MTTLLAAIQPGAPDPLAGLRENAAPVAVPWPPWVWWAIGGGGLVVLGLLIWLAYWLAHRKPKTVPLSPRQLALREIEDLRARAAVLEPYAFSVAVSDVLRTYITGQFGFRATEQTSPEFLASIGDAPQFTGEDRQLLADFLERCDLLKFAHVRAGAEENSELLRAATAFVQGSRA